MRAGPDKFRARNDNVKPATLVARYAGALSHITYEGLPPRLVQESAAVYEQAEEPDLADSDGSHWWFGGVARRP